MRAIHRTVLLVFLWTGAPQGPLGAQLPLPSTPSAALSGVVTDTTETPVRGVAVEAWLEGRLLGTRITGEDGAFAFAFPDDWTADLATGPLRLRANRLGFRALERVVDFSAGRAVILEMREEPIAVRGLVVESERPRCRTEDQDEARSLWNSMRTKYFGPMDTVGIATYLAEGEALVGRGEIGPLDLPSEREAQRGSSSQLRFSWSRRVRRSGYAFPVRRTDKGESFDSWSYAPLESDFAPHFVSSGFGELHRLRIRDQGSFGWIIEFCPEDPERPSIVGSLRLAPDTTLLEAEWLFRTGDPQENAGGHATFPPASESAEESYPLPRESIFWRRLPTGDFQEVHQLYEKWIVAPGDTVPFLAPR
ncbi:MAG: carboxypeptidase-like regulatory domain-containing protein [Longimicrobiales bacterium]